jgi:hypothetical protein
MFPVEIWLTILYWTDKKCVLNGRLLFKKLKLEIDKLYPIAFIKDQLDYETSSFEEILGSCNHCPFCDTKKVYIYHVNVYWVQDLNIWRDCYICETCRPIQNLKTMKKAYSCFKEEAWDYFRRSDNVFGERISNDVFKFHDNIDKIDQPNVFRQGNTFLITFHFLIRESFNIWKYHLNDVLHIEIKK